MAKSYSIACNCGHEVKGNDPREVEAAMWHHAIHDHTDMVKGMTVGQLEGIMKGWDKEFAAQK
jgi:predicted small metal-binding protein